MKRIVITGAKSYIGSSFERYVKQWSDKYVTDTVDMLDEGWRDVCFEGYDTVFHVAGIVHKKENRKNSALYYAVNRDLAVEVAEKAKRSGVRQFIFMSSMCVYGMITGHITKDTIEAPDTDYGKSKLEAEYKIQALSDSAFKVVILRPPMIYGTGCRGNYNKLAKLALMLPVFPDTDNKRSMLHIDNLCEFVKNIIENVDNGTFFPQNAEYVNTTEIARAICQCHGRKLLATKMFNGMLSVIAVFSNVPYKAFGSLTYDLSMSSYKNNYQMVDFYDSIKRTEDV